MILKLVTFDRKSAARYGLRCWWLRCWATVDTVVGGAIGGAFSWALVNLDHFAFVRCFLIFVVAHIEPGHDGGGGQRLGTNKIERVGRVRKVLVAD